MDPRISHWPPDYVAREQNQEDNYVEKKKKKQTSRDGTDRRMQAAKEAGDKKKADKLECIGAPLGNSPITQSENKQIQF